MKSNYIINGFQRTVQERFSAQSKALNEACMRRLAQLRVENKDASKEKQRHLEEQILPGIAVYETLKTVMTPEVLILFALPVLVGNLFQQMYTMVDTAVVGKYVSADALAGMGTTTPVITLILGIIIGMANGISVVIAQSFGSGDKRKTEKAVANGMILMLVLSLLVMGIGLISSRLLFYIMNVPDKILEDALIYVNILFLGTLPKAAYNYESGVLRAYGNSVVPLIFLAVTSVMNVLLDLLCARIFSMGVMGIAVATVISETCSAVCCFIFMKTRMPEVHVAKDAWVIDKEMIFQHIRTGIPSAFSQSCLGISFFFAQTALNSLGRQAFPPILRPTKWIPSAIW